MRQHFHTLHRLVRHFFKKCEKTEQRQVKSRSGLRSEVLIAIWEAFEKHDIQPPYPHHEIYLKNTSPVS